MRAEEFVTEKKKRKKRRARWAAYGPGPFGGYGYAAGYSGVGSVGGDGGGGVGEASYAGNIGAMEMAKFYQVATDEQKRALKDLINREKRSLAWELIQKVTGVNLQGKEFQTDEGWKDTLANLGIAGAIAAGGVGGMAAKQALTSPSNDKPSISQPADTGQRVSGKITSAPKQQDSGVSKKKVDTAKINSKNVTGSPHEAVLRKAAMAAGIKGAELAAFLAQTAHETGNFEHMVEIGGSLDFKKYDPKYAPRKARALGNKKVGDGAKYKGRGYIQLTGRYNYKRAGQALGLPLEAKPELVEKPAVAAKVAVWFWQQRVQPKVDNFHDTKSVTKPINPGLKGLEDRKDKFKDFIVAMQ
jgi:predicted chitinase